MEESGGWTGNTKILMDLFLFEIWGCISKVSIGNYNYISTIIQASRPYANPHFKQGSPFVRNREDFFFVNPDVQE